MLLPRTLLSAPRCLLRPAFPPAINVFPRPFQLLMDQIIRISALKLTDLPLSFKGKYPVHRAVEEIPVMGYNNDDPVEPV